jgi:excisionase family DNA binding protein
MTTSERGDVDIDSLPPARSMVIGPKEVARQLEVSIRQAQVVMGSGTIPGCFRIGRLVRVRRTDFEAWVAAQGVTT